MAKNDDIVMFLDADGREVSNDPRWIAEQQIRRFEDTVNDPEGTGDTLAYADQDGSTLKAEVKRRKEAGREIDTKGVTKKAELIALLEADDEAQKQEALEKAASGGSSEEEEESEEENE